MFGIVLLIVFNLGLGYALALYQHRAELTQPALVLRWPFSRWLPMPSLAGGPVLGDSVTVPPPEFTAGSPAPQNSSAADIAMAAPTATPAGALQEPITPVPATADSELPTALATTPSPRLIPVEQTVLEFQHDLQGYNSELGTLNQQVRQHAADSNPDGLQSYVAQFGQLTDRYLEQQGQRLQSLRASTDQPTQELREPCLVAVQQHAAALEATRGNVTGAAGLADAAAACREFLLATSRLADANQSFHQELDLTLQRVRPAEAIDAQEGSARALSDNLERAVTEFIQFQASGSQKFCVSLVEIDQLTTLNSQHGSAVSTRILQAIEQTFVSQSPRSTLATDPQRQQLLYFQMEITTRDAVRSVEQVRQRIAAANFQHENARLPVTMSCSVAEATGEQPPQQIVERLQAMLREAQRYGRNCTFFQEGEQSAPAIPPVINVESRLIEV